jgi:hypothetical protein
MALYQRYQIEFQDFRGVQDWRIEIWQDTDADPGLVNLTATGEPLTMEYNSESERAGPYIKSNNQCLFTDGLSAT